MNTSMNKLQLELLYVYKLSCYRGLIRSVFAWPALDGLPSPSLQNKPSHIPHEAWHVSAIKLAYA